ncbi:hypothetical protein [Litorilituus sediminis]|uniref:Uncharacterized protein n=1 Tax=Litorilituus sediminis TaxID=718192 RepID=A0A4P6P121_9GAMM|nr:hypothetical protein [Litorilituus sediminis]QBG34906.1 hypothetical protein EMK97_03725 [Litorilituus sediminis]
MTAIISAFSPSSKVDDNQVEIAVVSAVDTQGRISRIRLSDSDIETPLSGQAQHIAKANCQDSVVVMNSKQGWIAIALLATDNTPPAANIRDNDGHIVVKGEKSVTLSTAKGTVEVHENGSIILDACEINANSERDFTLAGWPIRLN